MTEPESSTGKSECVLDEMIYNDPYKVAMLVEMIKCKLKILDDRDINTSDCFDLACAQVSGHTAKSNLFTRDKETSLRRIFFAEPKTLSKFTMLFDLGTWENFRLAIPSILSGCPTTYSDKPNAAEKHKAYEIWYYENLSKIKKELRIREREGESEYSKEKARQLRQLYFGKPEDKRNTEKMMDLNDVRVVDHEPIIFKRKPPFFIGENRRKGLQECANYLDSAGKPLAIIGMAGLGKTNFAFNLIDSIPIVKIFGECRFLVFCETAFSYRAMLSCILEAMGVYQTKIDDNLEVLILTRLKNLPARKLILFDNFETCYDNYYLMLRTFLEKLENYANVAFTMRTNSAPQKLDCVPYQIPELLPYEAMGLFNHHSNSSFNKSEEEKEIVLQFIAEVGYLPLAVKLIASRARAVKKILDLYKQWKTKKIEMLELDETLDDKEINLKVSISLSYHSPRLRENDKFLLKALSGFPNAIKNGRGMISELTEAGFEMVERLIGVALVEESSEASLIIHPMIREYVNNQDIKSGIYESLIVNKYIELAYQSRLSTYFFLTNRFWVENRKNIYHAISCSIEDEKSVILLICMPVSKYLTDDSDYEGEHILVLSIQAFEDKRPNILLFRKALAHLAEAFRLLRVNDSFSRIDVFKNKIINQINEACSGFQTLQDKFGEATSLIMRGQLEYSCGDLFVAELSLQKARALFKGLGDQASEAKCHETLQEIARSRKL